ncbi:MAG: hypothetical protein ACLT98_03365 [Eggerthellaceae bacterium]
MGVRFTVAGIILGIVMLPRFRKALTSTTRKRLRPACSILVLGELHRAHRHHRSNTRFSSLYCVIIPFLGWALRGPRPTRFNIAAALVCVAGVGCVSFAGLSGFSLRFGDLITLLSAFFLSLHVLYTAKYARGRDMTLLTVVQFLVAGVLGFGAGNVRAHARVRQLGAGHVGEPGVLGMFACASRCCCRTSPSRTSTRARTLPWQPSRCSA